MPAYTKSMLKVLFGLVLVSLTYSAHALSLRIDLFDVNIPAEDAAVLFRLRHLNTRTELESEIHKAFPELEFAALEGGGKIEGRFVPAFGEFAGVSKTHPLILLKKEAGKDVFVHEFVHFLLDRARLRELNLQGTTSYLTYKAEQLTKLKLEFDQNRSKNPLLSHPFPELVLGSFQFAIFKDAEEVAVVSLLLKLADDIGLNRKELEPQLLYGWSHLEKLAHKYEDFMSLHFSQSDAPSEREIFLAQTIGPKVMDLLSKIKAAFSYFEEQSRKLGLVDNDCQQELAGETDL